MSTGPSSDTLATDIARFRDYIRDARDMVTKVHDACICILDNISDLEELSTTLEADTTKKMKCDNIVKQLNSCLAQLANVGVQSASIDAVREAVISINQDTKNCPHDAIKSIIAVLTEFDSHASTIYSRIPKIEDCYMKMRDMFDHVPAADAASTKLAKPDTIVDTTADSVKSYGQKKENAHDALTKTASVVPVHDDANHVHMIGYIRENMHPASIMKYKRNGCHKATVCYTTKRIPQIFTIVDVVPHYCISYKYLGKRQVFVLYRDLHTGRFSATEAHVHMIYVTKLRAKFNDATTGCQYTVHYEDDGILPYGVSVSAPDSPVTDLEIIFAK